MGTTAALRDSIHPSLTRRTPASNDDFFDDTQLTELREYVAPLRRNRRIRKTLTWIADLAIVFGFDLAPRIDDAVAGQGWVVRLLAISLVLSLIQSVIDLPFDAWTELVYDKRHGLSTTTTKTWVIDQFKGLALGTVLGAALFLPIYAAIHSFDMWWLIGGLAVVAVIAVFAFVYPVLIMPRFNKFTPLPEGEIRTRVEEIAALSGIQIQGVYLMDASKRTTRPNAGVTGFGRTKRVILNDTICDFPIEQLSQVIAHELGHYRLKHTIKSFPLTAITLPATLAFIQFMAGNATVLGWAGVENLGDPGSFGLFTMAFGIPSSAIGLLTRWQSRTYERAADLEALELLVDPTSFVGVWPRMVADAKANMEPTRYERLNATHPQVSERMQFGLDWAEMNGVSVIRPEKGAIPEGAGKPTPEPTPEAA